MASSGSPNRAAIESALLAFITDVLGWTGDPAALVGPAGARLTEVLDSQGLIEAAGFAEDEFGIEIDNAEITQENFGSLSRLVELVGEKLLANATVEAG